MRGLVAGAKGDDASDLFNQHERNLDMKKPIRWIASLSVLALSPLIGVWGCGNPADDVAPAKVSAPKPAAPTSSPAATPSAGSPAAKPASPRDLPQGAEVLAITPETSKIDFVGSKVTGHHNGGFKSFEGTWALVPEKPEASRINAEIDVTSTWTDTDRLTGHLKSPDFFDVAKFPKSTFESTEITPGSTDSKAKDATHTVAGNLTLHGVTKSIQFPARIAVTPEAADLTSEFFLNRKDFQINYPGMANDLIRDEVVIKVAVHAPRKH
jgi:polyisoprenoid-binding protein YceI